MSYFNNNKSYFDQPDSSEQKRNKDNQEMRQGTNRIVNGATTFDQVFGKSNGKPLVIRRYPNYHYGW